MKRAVLHRSIRSCCVRNSWLAGQAPPSLEEASLLMPDRTLFFFKARGGGDGYTAQTVLKTAAFYT